ncbi:hypothetical protein [Methanofollis sp. UBA420]|uniref:hypothetical protein n=1 Tax=Methanofollis sp. UBA420 TaxID=1915514 RepID=UPI00316ADD33
MVFDHRVFEKEKRERGSMKPNTYGEIGTLVLCLCFLLVFAAGCLVQEYGISRDIMVFKVDAGGTEQWQTVIDTGGDDIADTIIQTEDGDYLIGGRVWPWRGDSSYGIFRVDSNGAFVWNVTDKGDPISSLTRTMGDTIVAVSGSRLLFFDQVGNPLDDDGMETDGVLRSVTGTADGGFVAAGKAGGDVLVLKRDRNLTEEWRNTYGADGQDDAWTIIQTSDGGYLVSGITEPAGRTDYDLWVLRLNATGDLLWKTTLIETDLLKGAEFMGELPEGGCSVIYSNVTLEKGRYVRKIVDVTFDHEGKVLEEKAVNAELPIIKTTDGGYVSGNVTYHTVSRYLIRQDQVGVPHIMKLRGDGLQEWNTELNSTFELIGDPVSVIQTADGGYVLLVNRQNYPKEPE